MSTIEARGTRHYRSHQDPLLTVPEPSGAQVQKPVLDMFQRPLGDLRVSVIDRCNLRCQYCMPEEEYAWLSRQDTLTFEEILRIVDVFVSLGTRKVRVTGGEPLLRTGLPDLINALAERPGIQDLAITTNGVLLARNVRALKQAGLRRVSVSLDTLRPEVFQKLSRRSTHGDVIAGIRSVPDAGFTDTKLDTVVMRGVNHEELVDLIEFARTVPAEIRFIEYMDVGGATTWAPEKVFSRKEMVAALTAHYGSVESIRRNSSAPADRFRLPDGYTFGIVSSTSQPFCTWCDRSRLTADGMWFKCLYASEGTDLRTPLRDGAGTAELTRIVREGWSARNDRGAMDRLAARDRLPLFSVESLKRDPHLEMHTRGG